MKETALKFFVNKTENTSVQAFRYVLAGVTAIFIDFWCLWLFVESLKINHLVAAAAAFGIGLTTNYSLSTSWVFKERKIKSRKLEYSIFAMTGLLGLFLTEVIVWFFTDMVHFHYIISKSISFVVIYTVNFYLRRAILFK